MRTAEEIKAAGREAVSVHNVRVAQATAHEAFRELTGRLLESQLRFSISSEYAREDVTALLEQLAPYLALLAEVAPALPAKVTPAAEQEAA